MKKSIWSEKLNKQMKRRDHLKESRRSIILVFSWQRLGQSMVIAINRLPQKTDVIVDQYGCIHHQRQILVG